MARRISAKTKRRAVVRRRVGIAVVGLIVLIWIWGRNSDDQVYVTSDVEALARVIRSEIGVGTDKQKLHVAWTARNLANAKGVNVAKLVCSPCGRQGRGRPLSSWQPATERDRVIARKVLQGRQSSDPTHGATHFLNPRLQDKLARSGRTGYRGNTYNKVARRWRKSYGWEPYYRVGRTLELWGPRRKEHVRKRRSGRKRKRRTLMDN